MKFAQQFYNIEGKWGERHCSFNQVCACATFLFAMPTGGFRTRL